MTDDSDISPAGILAFWREAGCDAWYERNDAFDVEVRRRFLALWQKAVAGELLSWEATDEGALAVRTLIAAGINVNITLLFAIEAHARVIDAYMKGLEDRLAAGKPIERLASRVVEHQNGATLVPCERERPPCSSTKCPSSRMASTLVRNE